MYPSLSLQSWQRITTVQFKPAFLSLVHGHETNKDSHLGAWALSEMKSSKLMSRPNSKSAVSLITFCAA
ncbi:hypothetical protein FRX31_016900 [Thalictrum thalictroides]|uniref:Uncharacterized protein n=1 Tax=Thalictrum thalictroides TaxID=46969 RepID=A0A7J6WBF5_THATH|nr:hypothetical protein FRX31_016900 [Thalictrum thalictroides]